MPTATTQLVADIKRAVGVERHEDLALPDDVFRRKCRQLARLTPESPAWRALRDRLVYAHLLLVLKWASRFAFSGVAEDDLVQLGLMGLLQAVPKFDPERIDPKTGKLIQFSTYASWWIMQAMRRASGAKPISLPPQVQDQLEKLRRIDLELRQANDDLETPIDEEELARAMSAKSSQSYTADDIRQLQAWQYHFTSLDAPLSSTQEGGRVQYLADILPAPADAQETVPEDDALEQIFDTAQLDLRERKVLLLRYGLHPNRPDYAHTLLEVGRELHLIRERVRQIELRAMKKLRRAYPQEDELFAALGDLSLSA